MFVWGHFQTTFADLNVTLFETLIAVTGTTLAHLFGHSACIKDTPKQYSLPEWLLYTIYTVDPLLTATSV